MNKTGGVLLLQEMEPKRLLAVLGPVIPDKGLGWVHASFFPEPGLFAIELTPDGSRLVIDSAIALSFAGILQMQVAQNRWLRDEKTPAVRATQSIFTVRRTPKPGKGHVYCAWARDVVGIEQRAVEAGSEQMEVRIREDLAAVLAEQIIDELARFAAGAPEPPGNLA